MCRSDGGGGGIVYRWRWTVQEWRWTAQQVEVEVDCTGVVDIMVLGGGFCGGHGGRSGTGGGVL